MTPLVAKDEAEVTTSLDNSDEAKDTKLTANNIDNAYRHGLRIEFLGDYLTTLDYLKKS